MKNIAPGLLWSFPTLVAAWLWAPHPLAVVGGLSGCLSATLLSQFPASRNLWIGFLLSCLTGFIALATLGSIPVTDPSAQILIRSAVLCWLTSHSILFLLHQATPSAFIPLECALFATPWVLWLKAHRFGNLDRPVALMEWLQSMGIDPTRALAGLGIFVGVGIVLLVGSRRSRGLGLQPSLILISLALVLTLLLPTQSVGRLAVQNSQSLGAGQAQEQKASTPVAVVVFYSDYQPELEVYHFRPYQEGDEPLERPPSRQLRYRVAEVKAQDQFLAQGWDARRTPIVVPDGKSFASVYEVHSQVPSLSLAQQMEEAPPAVPEPAPQSRWEAVLDEAVPLQDRSHPLRAALRIKLWMEQNRIQGAETVQGSVEDSLLKKKPVNQETFVKAAHQLLQDLGVPNSVVSGYAVRTEQKGTGSYLLITEQDRRWWIELKSPGYGGLIIDLYPLDAPNQSDTPQNFDLQRQLGELARAREPQYQPLPGLGMGSLGGLVLVLVSMGLGYAVKLYRWVRGHSSNSPRTPVWAYRAVLDRLAEVEELRASGETRYEFSRRLKEAVPSLEPLTINFQRHTLGSPGSRETDESVSLARACDREISQTYSFRRRWFGYLHPFSWLKVR